MNVSVFNTRQLDAPDTDAPDMPLFAADPVLDGDTWTWPTTLPSRDANGLALTGLAGLIVVASAEPFQTSRPDEEAGTVSLTMPLTPDQAGTQVATSVPKMGRTTYVAIGCSD